MSDLALNLLAFIFVLPLFLLILVIPVGLKHLIEFLIEEYKDLYHKLRCLMDKEYEEKKREKELVTFRMLAERDFNYKRKEEEKDE